ncbi:fasciclin-1 isoform X1 [Schistocerca piceifrons]|uniref:fasciclin-1 isoform X1 n=1 Tax=Schistocerca piceifrons TaxID=274613 RepID=UPI001F5F4E4F|nr:fasciclin-1 isoform X1 [Schistocerca piceifrons]XP_047100722.1 fasciclin-1 isoform X1 [Schistocerca piceifrons]XP_047100723.1 fasciclin-1 isoform X1 [Schistocerca piceifrons]
MQGPRLTALLLLLLTLAADRASAKGEKSLEYKIRDDPDLSQFYSWLEHNEVANSTLQLRQVTVFAPTNLAFQNYKARDGDENIILYHMTNLAHSLDQLGHKVLSELDGNPPLWITRRRDTIFVNNARVLTERSNYEAVNRHGKKQVLHVVDSVLEPVWSTSGQLYNPDAFQFLNQSENLDLGLHRVRSFRQRVFQNQKQNDFKLEGKHTFFIPVDEGFKPLPRPEKIDQKVIDGHIIPNHVLFTSATPLDEEYETLAFTDMLRVVISFTMESDGKAHKPYVKSNTVIGDANHATGAVLAEIVKANIPVKNGVVHLIQRPLMVVDNTVKQFLESFKGFEKEDGPLYKFYQVILDAGGDFINQITEMKDLTLFAPSNAAWSETTANNLLTDRKKFREILNLHIVAEKLSIESIVEQNVKQIRQVPTMADRKNLYFNVVHGPAGNKTVTVEGGGVNATIVQPNIAATNGMVHIINKILGVPYTTVKEKLRTDPMLNKTYHLGEMSDFNKMLDEKHTKFTYFVPRDLAWKKMEVRDPSAHRKLFMKEFTYQVKQILERHLVISDRVYTMGALKKLASNTSSVLPTMRDHLRLRVRETEKSKQNQSRYTSGYYVEWQGEWIHIFRPDVECTNGIIHVMDYVFMKEGDIVVGGPDGAGQQVASLAVVASTHLVVLATVRWLLH